MDWRRGNSQDKNRTLTQMHTSSAMSGLVHSSLTEQPGCTSGIGTSRGGTLGRLSPQAEALRLCWSTSTSEVISTASVSRRVCAAGRNFCGIIRPKHSSPVRVWGYGVTGHQGGYGVYGYGAGTGCCGIGVCLRMSWPWLDSTVGSSSTMASASSAHVFTISPWPIVRDSWPSSSSLSSSSSSSSFSTSSSSSFSSSSYT